MEGFLHGLFPGPGRLSVKEETYGRRERRGETLEVPKSEGNPAGVSSCQESTCALKDNNPSEMQGAQSLPDADVREPTRCPEGKSPRPSPIGD